MIKQCSKCKKEYTLVSWEKLAYVGLMKEGGDIIELRNCICNNTLSVDYNETLALVDTYYYYDRLESAQAGAQVIIFETNETGKLMYAVSLDDGYWLDSFVKLDDAKKFCEFHSIKNVRILGAKK